MNTITPKQIIIETSSRCQLRCLGCPICSSEATGSIMSLPLFKSIIDRAITITPSPTIIPWMNGESLLNPHITEMIEYVSSQNLRQYITTNGMIWNEDLFRHLTSPSSTCYQLIFSLDGIPSNRSKSIEAARPGSNRQRILTTIENFGDLKLRKKSNIDMAVKICQRGQDWGEIEAYIHHWLSKPYISYVVYGKMLEEKTATSQRIYPCQYFDNNFLILRTDGSSRLCAYHPEVVNNGANPVGTLKPSEDLLSFYNNERFTFYRSEQNEGAFHGPCATCAFAYTGFGFEGEITLRNPHYHDIGTIFFHQDYYNMFFSKVKKQKPPSYYLPGGSL